MSDLQTWASRQGCKQDKKKIQEKPLFKSMLLIKFTVIQMQSFSKSRLLFSMNVAHCTVQ